MTKILSKREKIILFATIGIIAFAVVFNLFLAPLLSKNSDLNRQINFTRTKIKKYLWLLSHKDKLQAKYNKFYAGVRIQSESQDPLVTALSELEALAKNANIRIIDIRPQQTKPSDLYPEILIDVRLEGTMEGYLNFIYNLENSPSLFKIRRFQLTAKANSPTLEGAFSVSQLGEE